MDLIGLIIAIMWIGSLAIIGVAILILFFGLTIKDRYSWFPIGWIIICFPLMKYIIIPLAQKYIKDVNWLGAFLFVAGYGITHFLIKLSNYMREQAEDRFWARWKERDRIIKANFKHRK